MARLLFALGSSLNLGNNKKYKWTKKVRKINCWKKSKNYFQNFFRSWWLLFLLVKLSPSFNLGLKQIWALVCIGCLIGSWALNQSISYVYSRTNREVHYKSLFGDNYFIIVVLMKEIYLPRHWFFAGIQTFSMKLFLKMNS